MLVHVIQLNVFQRPPSPQLVSKSLSLTLLRFLLQCLDDLDQSLRRLNSRLFVIRGQPAEKLPILFKKWNTTCLTFEEDPEPFSRVRDNNISEMCKELNIEVISAVSHTLYKLEKYSWILLFFRNK